MSALVLADGREFLGRSFGAEIETTGEVVFTTGMTGYEEVLTDPSYTGQIVVMTAPQIGNVGITLTDEESSKPHLRALIVRDASPTFSSWRARESLDAYLSRHGVAALSDVDTRALTRHLRDQGSQNGAIGEQPEGLKALARSAPDMRGLDLVRVACPQAGYRWDEASDPNFFAPLNRPLDKHVVAIDYGMKRNILRRLVDEGCRVTAVPATASAKEILALEPDGIFLSNGPGDPAALGYAVETVRSLLGQRPIFGICLGHQLLALALGAKTYKLKFGHRGTNQPVKDLESGRIEITSQNHGFAVDVASLPSGVEPTHVHLNDQSSEGLRSKAQRAFSVQFHPEAAAGPHDSHHLFSRFRDQL